MLCCLVINLYFAVILNFLELNCESRVFNCIGCFLPHMLMSELSWEYRKIPHVSDACTCNILNTVAILLSGVITWQVCNNTCPVFKLVKA